MSIAAPKEYSICFCFFGLPNFFSDTYFLGAMNVKSQPKSSLSCRSEAGSLLEFASDTSAWVSKMDLRQSAIKASC